MKFSDRVYILFHIIRSPHQKMGIKNKENIFSCFAVVIAEDREIIVVIRSYHTCADIDAILSIYLRELYLEKFISVIFPVFCLSNFTLFFNLLVFNVFRKRVFYEIEVFFKIGFCYFIKS